MFQNVDQFFFRSGAVGGRMVVAASGFDVESSKYMGIDAVKKLRLQYNINKVRELSLKYLPLFDFPLPALPLRSFSSLSLPPLYSPLSSLLLNLSPFFPSLFIFSCSLQAIARGAESLLLTVTQKVLQYTKTFILQNDTMLLCRSTLTILLFFLLMI